MGLNLSHLTVSCRQQDVKSRKNVEWEDLHLSRNLLKGIFEAGWERPSPIQVCLGFWLLSALSPCSRLEIGSLFPSCDRRLAGFSLRHSIPFPFTPVASSIFSFCLPMIGRGDSPGPPRSSHSCSCQEWNRYGASNGLCLSC